MKEEHEVCLLEGKRFLQNWLLEGQANWLNLLSGNFDYGHS